MLPDAQVRQLRRKSAGNVQRWKMKNLCIVFLFLHTDGLLYPYGPSTDKVTPKLDDGVSPPIPSTIPLFGKKYSSIYVNNNGLLSFDVALESSAPQHLPIATPGPCLAPFWTDVNNEILGAVYYRLSKDLVLLNMTGNDISSYFPAVPFSPKWVFVATWEKVSYFDSKTNKVNTFQAVLSTDGNATFIMFNYGDIQWPTGKENEGPPALAGCNSGFSEGYFEIPGSLTGDMINITQTSNVNFPGRWVFRVDQVEVETPTMNKDSTTSPTPTKAYFTSQKVTDLPLTNYTTGNTKVTSPSLGSSTSTAAITMQNTTVITTRVTDSTTSPTPTKAYFTSQKVTDLPSTKYTTDNTKVTSPSLGSSTSTTTITMQNTTAITTRVPGQQGFYPVVVYAPILGCFLLVMVIILTLFKRHSAVKMFQAPAKKCLCCCLCCWVGAGRAKIRNHQHDAEINTEQ